MSFLEHRLLSQRSPDAPRGIELPSADELRSLADTIGKRAEGMIQQLLSPQNRREINRIVEGLSKEFVQVKDQLFAEIQRDIPKLKNYFRLGGSFGARAGNYQLEEQMNRLRVLNGERPVDVPARSRGFLSSLVGNNDGTSDVLELYGEDATPFSGEIGGGFTLGNDGVMVSLLAETRAENARLSAERGRVLNESLSKLEALRKEVEQDEGGVAPQTEEGVTVDPTTGERRVGNVPLRPGETPVQLRARLNQELQVAEKAFNEQRDLVRKLTAEGVADDTIKPEREKLMELRLALDAAEGQVKGLEGLRQPDSRPV